MKCYSATFAVHVFLKEPSLFNAYIASSPDLGDEEIMRLEDSSLNYLNERNSTLFLSSAMEGWAQKDVNRLDSMLKRKPQKGLSYQVTAISG